VLYNDVKYSQALKAGRSFLYGCLYEKDILKLHCQAYPFLEHKLANIFLY
jgi:hypothetical protein